MLGFCWDRLCLGNGETMRFVDVAPLISGLICLKMRGAKALSRLLQEP